MVDIDIINSEIEFLKTLDTTYEHCEQLAWLYIVADHLAAEKTPQSQSVVSEFLQLAAQADTCSLMRVIDEHMDAIKLVFPAEYEAVMTKIRAIAKR